MFPVAAFLIIAVEFCERLCFYTFSGTQKIWLQNQGFANAQSSSIHLIFGSLTFVCAFCGGWCATRVGLFRTIAACAAVYVVGTYLAALAVLPGVESVPLYMLGTMVLVTMGAGGIKPNVCILGADQIGTDSTDAESKRASFFVYFYCIIKLGAAGAHGILSSVAISGLPALNVAEEYGFVFTYMVAATFMLMALLLFVGGRRLYRKDVVRKEVVGKPAGEQSPLRQFATALLRARRHPLRQLALLGWALLPWVIITATINAFVKSHALKMACLVVDVSCMASLIVAHRDNRWLPAGDVARSLDLVPCLLVGNFLVGFLSSLGDMYFQSMACQMDARTRRHDPDAYQLSGDFFRLGNSVSILMWAPTVDRIIYPLLRRCLGRPVSSCEKVVAGSVIMVVAQLAGALIEKSRRDAGSSGVPSLCAPLLPDGEHVPASDISACWMFTPYFLMGIGEVGMNPVLQHMAYEGATPAMRPMMQAFNLLAIGALPGAVASAASQAMSALVPNNLDDGNLPTAFLIESAVGVLGIAVYLFVFKSAPPHVRDIGLGAVQSESAQSPPSSGGIESSNTEEDQSPRTFEADSDQASDSAQVEIRSVRV